MRLVALGVACFAVIAAGSAGFTEYAPAAPERNAVISIAVGPDGAMWFAEPALIDDGRTPQKIGRITAGGRIDEFKIDSGSFSPTRIAPGPDGKLWVALNQVGEGHAKLALVDTSGRATIFPAGLQAGLVLGIAAAPSGDLWFTVPGADRIGRMTSSGTMTSYRLPEHSGPGFITRGPDNAMWFTEGFVNRVGRIDAAGKIRSFYLPDSPGYPFAITASPDGTLWYTKQSRIGRMTPRGETREYRLPNPDSQAEDIIAGPDGAMWFSEDAGKIGRIDAAGHVREFPIPAPHSLIRQLVVGPDGALWFVLSGENKIGRLQL